MPFTSKDFSPINRMGKKGASPFSGSQFGSVPQSPEFSGGNARSASAPAVSDPNSPTTPTAIPNQSGDDAPGVVGHEPTPTASGSGADAADSGSTGSPTHSDAGNVSHV